MTAIAGAMANLGYRLSYQTVGNILQRHGIPPAQERQRTTTWADFIRAHLSVLVGTDFFSVEVIDAARIWSLTTCFSSFVWRAVALRLLGITPHPNEA